MFTSSPLNKDLGLLVLRLIGGGLMALLHGWPKLQGFADKADSFPDPLGLGPLISLILVVFAEFFCALLVMLGLYTRAFTIPLIITMIVAAFITHEGDPIAKKELALIYLAIYTTILLAGAGKYSLNRVSFR